MILYIVRHAWAEERDATKWPDDRDRPLTDKGRERFRRVVASIVGGGFNPQLVVTSRLARCHQTAEILADLVSAKPNVVDRDELSPGGEIEELLAWTNRAATRLDSVAWVGHAPDVDEMAASLIGDAAARIRFAKGAIAAIDFDAGLPLGNGTLRWMVTAKMLGL